MMNQMIKPTLASREYVVLPCATDMSAADRRGSVALGAFWGTGVSPIDAPRVRVTGKHTGFAHSAGSLTWSPPT